MRHLKPLKRFPQTDALTYPELKLGVNERDFARRYKACRTAGLRLSTFNSNLSTALRRQIHPPKQFCKPRIRTKIVEISVDFQEKQLYVGADDAPQD